MKRHQNMLLAVIVVLMVSRDCVAADPPAATNPWRNVPSIWTTNTPPRYPGAPVPPTRAPSTPAQPAPAGNRPNEQTYTNPQPTVVTPNTVPAAIDPHHPPSPPPEFTGASGAGTKPIVPIFTPPPTANELASQFLRPKPPTNTISQAAETVVQPSLTSNTVVAAPVVAAPKSNVPFFNKPVMFNTPEADAILSKMEIFPPDNAWHKIISDWPVHPNSKNIVATVHGGKARFTYNLDMCFIIVPPNQGAANVQIAKYPKESDKGPYPLPDNLPIEGWPIHTNKKGIGFSEWQRNEGTTGYSDRHAIVVDPVNRLLYEFFRMEKSGAGWRADQASIFDLSSNKLRPAGWTSADAAGLPIFPAVVRYDELKRGQINHALRVTVPKTQRAYVAPATHYASDSVDKDLPRMGERLRLRRGFDVTGFSPEVRTILTALQKHGMLVADNGELFAISVAPDSRIPDVLNELHRLTVADFDVVTAPKK